MRPVRSSGSVVKRRTATGSEVIFRTLCCFTAAFSIGGMDSLLPVSRGRMLQPIVKVHNITATVIKNQRVISTSLANGSLGELPQAMRTYGAFLNGFNNMTISRADSIADWVADF